MRVACIAYLKVVVVVCLGCGGLSGVGVHLSPGRAKKLYF